jgi:hypothetical protein
MTPVAVETAGPCATIGLGQLAASQSKQRSSSRCEMRNARLITQARRSDAHDIDGNRPRRHQARRSRHDSGVSPRRPQLAFIVDPKATNRARGSNRSGCDSGLRRRKYRRTTLRAQYTESGMSTCQQIASDGRARERDVAWSGLHFAGRGGRSAALLRNTCARERAAGRVAYGGRAPGRWRSSSPRADAGDAV